MPATLRNQVLAAVSDLRGNASAKHIAKHLGANPDSVSSTLFTLKKERLVESAGYARYALTEDGRGEVGRAFASIAEAEHPAPKPAPQAAKDAAGGG